MIKNVSGGARRQSLLVYSQKLWTDLKTTTKKKISRLDAIITNTVINRIKEQADKLLKQEQDVNFDVHGKKLRFAKKSLFIFSDKNKFRQKLVWIVESKAFEICMIVIIFANSLILAIHNYEYRIYPNNTYVVNTIGNITEYIFSPIFIIEFILRVIAQGFCLEPGTYLRDPWNILDFIVVISSIFAFLPNVPSASGLRATRMLRPLRGINSLPGIKLLISTLIKSIPALGNAVLFLFFLIILFSLMGVQLFSNCLEYRCRYTEFPPSDGSQWPQYVNSPYLCGWKSCPEGYYCKNSFEYGAPSDNMDLEYLNYGFTRFDNIFYALLTVFQVFTAQNWTPILYLYWNNINPFISSLYFNILIFLAAFFLVNLILAVICESFANCQKEMLIDLKRQKEKKLLELQNEAKKSQDEKKKNDQDSEGIDKNKIKLPDESIDENEQLKNSSENIIENSLNLSPKLKNVSPTLPVINEECEKLDESQAGLLKKTETINQNKESGSHPSVVDSQPEQNGRISSMPDDAAHLSSGDLVTDPNEIFKTIPDSNLNQILNVSQKQNTFMQQLKEYLSKLFISKVNSDKAIPERANKNKIYYYCYVISYSPFVTLLTMFFILLNTIILALDKYPVKDSTSSFIQLSSGIINFYFIADIIIKLIGTGIKEFARDTTNLIDTIIVIFGLVEFIISAATGWSNTRTAVSAFRSFRLFRLFKLAQSWSSLRELLKVMTQTLKDLTYFLLLILLYMIVASLVGRELFAYTSRFDKYGRAYSPENGPIEETSSPRVNLDTLGNSLITMFIYLTKENWDQIMISYMRTDGPALPLIFFIPVLIIGNFILLNLFLAILFSNFAKSKVVTNSQTLDVSKLSKFFDSIKLYLEKIRYKLSLRDYFIKKYGQVVFDDEEKVQKENAIIELKKGDDKIFPDHLKPSPIKTRARLMKLKNHKDILNQLEDRIGKFNESDKSALLAILGKQTYYKKEKPEGFAFYFLGPKNKIRVFIMRVVSSPHFDAFMTAIIILSGIFLALDLPLRSPDDPFKKFVTITDLLISIVFVGEFLFKILAYGFLLNGSKSYLLSGWNAIDFVVVIFFFLSLFMGSLFSKIKILRAIRILRPLRIVSKSEEIQVAINCILRSARGILTVVLICILFFLIFSIFGVTYFKGSFYHCDMGNIYESEQINIIDKWSCLDYGGDWVNSDQNFDNVFKAMAIMFQLSINSGWINIMFQAIDSVGIDQQPIENNNMYWSIFFIIFIIISSFFILNLFAGVVVDTFQREKNSIRGYFLMTKQQADWVNIQLFILNTIPEKNYAPPKNKWRKKIYDLVNKKFFFIFINICIVANTLIFLLYYNRQPHGFSLTLDILNVAFLCIFTIEAILKIIGNGKNYFYDSWNKFDFSIIVFSIIGFILDLSQLFHLRTTISVLRSLRVASLLRLVKQAKGIRMILNTFIITLPSLLNVGSLLLLVLYVYSIIGMNLFAYIKIGEGITLNSNFQHFGLAFMTLFRISTGEDWYLIQNDCLRYIRPNNICFDISSYSELEEHGIMGCGSSIAYIYFSSFMIFFSLILLNLFVAIILQAYYETSKYENFQITPIHYLNFQKQWAKHDPKGKGIIKIEKLISLLRSIVPPLGPPPQIFYSPAAKVEFISKLNIPIYVLLLNHKKYFHYYDVLISLTYHVLEETPHYTGKLFPKERLNIHFFIEKQRIKHLERIKHIYRTPFTSSHLIAVNVIIRYAKKFFARYKGSNRTPSPHSKINKKLDHDSSTKTIDSPIVSEKKLNAFISTPTKEDESIKNIYQKYNEQDESINLDSSQSKLLSFDVDFVQESSTQLNAPSVLDYSNSVCSNEEFKNPFRIQNSSNKMHVSSFATKLSDQDLQPQKSAKEKLYDKMHPNQISHSTKKSQNKAKLSAPRGETQHFWNQTENDRNKTTASDQSLLPDFSEIASKKSEIEETLKNEQKKVKNSGNLKIKIHFGTDEKEFFETCLMDSKNESNHKPKIFSKFQDLRLIHDPTQDEKSVAAQKVKDLNKVKKHHSKKKSNEKNKNFNSDSDNEPNENFNNLPSRKYIKTIPQNEDTFVPIDFDLFKPSKIEKKPDFSTEISSNKSKNTKKVDEKAEAHDKALSILLKKKT